jgi:hypothetical protein
MYPKLHQPTQNFLREMNEEITPEESAQIFSDEEDYEALQNKQEYIDQIHADCMDEDFPKDEEND